MQDSFDKIPPHRKSSLWNFLGLAEGSPLPHRQTITDALALLAPEEINGLLLQFFRWSIKQKIFYNHQKEVGPLFFLACDGFVVHCYAHPHAFDKEGKNTCPYCLPRTRNKGSPEEKTYWTHVFLNLAAILPGGIQMPLYVYALKAEQLKGHDGDSDSQHKQECELQAAKEVLPLIRKEFPKLPFVFLGDSLYANEPMIELCKKLRLDFLIVRQEGALKNLAKRCDELEKLDLYQAYRSQKSLLLKNGTKKVSTIKWFNGERVGDQEVSVIRFSEITYDDKEKEQSCYKTEWLSSRMVFKKNCCDFVTQGRLRADHEDLHNTLKNRGFNAKHDYARKNPNASLIWKMLMFVAFWIFELFSCTVLAQKSRGSSPWKRFAEHLLIELLCESWETLSCSPSLCKKLIQFRFNFSGH